VITDRLEGRLAEVRDRVARAALRVDRDPATIELLPVTKGHPATSIEAVSALGLSRIGENRVPEAEAKQRSLGGRAGIAWHLIGRLQRNKARRALGLFDTIESVDSVRIAHHLSRIVEEENRDPVSVLIQVNASGEAAKAGFSPEETVTEMGALCGLPGLRVKGLMTMAPYAADERTLRSTFRKVRELSERCADSVPGFEGSVLSMGMSNDFEIAIEEGSTRVRLGTVLLGER
jgi:pyridoxal phosphate enzyme (YggS family)